MKILILVCVFVFLLLTFLRKFEFRSVFIPEKYPAGYWQPDAYGLNVEEVYFTSEDNTKLHGWFFHAENARATILWSHGNAGNVSHRLDNLSKFTALPFNVLLYDYRGYGKSEGTPSEPGLYKDARAAYDYLITRDEVKPESIVIYGRSLGGAVAVELALKRPSKCLILEATFTSAEDMAKYVLGPLPVGWLQRMKFASIDKIKKLTVPLLVMHGDRDDVVPYDFGKELFEAANEPKEFYEITGADHNDTYLVGGKPYYDKIEKFILKNL